MTPPAGAHLLWHDPVPRPGWAQMAIDLALLDLAQRDGVVVLRCYRWWPHCLSFGSHEPAARRYDRDRIRTLGLDVVRRPTGGRGVWHAGELTYAVAAPADRFGPLQDAYRAIHETLAAAVRALGAPATLAGAAGREPRLEAGPCFARPVGGEVLVHGHKVVGSAQLRRGGALLQHGSVLLDDDQRLVAELLPGGEPTAEAPLNRLLDRPVTWEAVAGAVAAAAAGWCDRWISADPAPLLAAAARYEPLFQSLEWTWRR